jgi:uncharacterized pyridoxamine 5'-phosphate oxidase family protein
MTSQSINTAREALAQLLASQNLAVLATQDQGQPYTSLVAFAASADMEFLYFATSRSTRKYANLLNNPNVAMMMDNRENRPSDFAEAMAATAVGGVEALAGNALAEPQKIFLQKHPHLAEFLAAPETALVRLNVSAYYVVTRFQDVVELSMR